MKLDLFLISFLTLFLELTCIRWFPSHVLFLTFFTNTAGGGTAPVGAP